jgi:hypothetical protein
MATQSDRDHEARLNREKLREFFQHQREAAPRRPFGFFHIDLDAEADGDPFFAHAQTTRTAPMPGASLPDAAILQAQLDQARIQLADFQGRDAVQKTLIQSLQRQLEAARHQARTAPSSPALDAQTLKELIVLCHPDKWPDNPLAHAVTARLTSLYDKQTKPRQR